MPLKGKARKILTNRNVRAAAIAIHYDEGALEIDDNATISRSADNEDHGAYVQAWIWVRDEEVFDFMKEPYEESA